MIDGGVQVINAGLPLIVEGVPAPDVTQLDWRPPAFSDLAAARAMVALDDETTAAANAAAIAAVHAVRPRVVGIRPARAAIDALAGPARTMLHAGPPIEYSRMCGPMRGALVGAALLEGWAATPAEAERALAAGEIAVEPCHHHGRRRPDGRRGLPVDAGLAGHRRRRPAPRHAFATLNEGLGTVLRFGAYGPEVIDRLRWMSEVLGPVLDAAIQASEPIDVTTLIGQALAMGDEGHNRSVAASALLARRLAPAIAPLDGAVEVLRFLAGNDHFALNLSMAAAKLCMDAAAHVPDSSLVTVMSRNGVEFGIRVAGTGDRWYTAPVGPADGLFFPGYGPDDANPDMGDSAITETLGIGGFAMAASPSITTFVGGTPADALAASRSMRRITLAPHPAFPLPPLNFAGSPSGIDVLKVLDTCELPLINTGIAHREAGVGPDRRRHRHRPTRGVPRGGARPGRGRGSGDMIEPATVVLIAIGGNALVHEGESGSLCRQQERSAAFAGRSSSWSRTGGGCS